MPKILYKNITFVLALVFATAIFGFSFFFLRHTNNPLVSNGEGYEARDNKKSAAVDSKSSGGNPENEVKADGNSSLNLVMLDGDNINSAQNVEDAADRFVQNASPLLYLEIKAAFSLLDNFKAQEKRGLEENNPREIKVPEDYRSIQLAIDEAKSQDIIKVSAGEYKEKIIMKEGISVVGENAQTVTLDAENSGNVVTFMSGITAKTRFAGFTVKNSGASLNGIFIENSSPLIDNNILTDNEYGMFIKGNSSPTVQRNTIRFANKGIQVYNFEKTAVRDDQSKPIIIDNLITDNKIGIDLYNSSALIDHNTISYNNHYKTYLGPTFGLNLSKSSPEITNNIITDSGICELCSGINADEESKGISINYNDIWNNKNNLVCFGECVLNNSNISEDPLFTDSLNGDFRLRKESVLIGKGTDESDIGVRW